MFQRLLRRRKARQIEHLLSRGEYLASEFQQSSEIHDIDEAIVLDRKALNLCPPSLPERAECLSQLSSHLWDRHSQLGGMEYISEAVALDREVLGLHPPGHPDRSSFLINLAIRLHTQYKQSGRVEDLNEATDLNREALLLCPAGSPNRSSALNNLAMCLFSRFEQLGQAEDLDEGIALSKEDLELCHSDRAISLNNLALHLWSRYNLFGRIEDLREAIDLNQEALNLRPPPHPLRSSTLNNLALCLHARYQHLGGHEDLSQAITLSREDLAFCLPGHPERPISLNNLAHQLWTRHTLLGRAEDLHEAIDLNREALRFCLPGHPHRSTSLYILAMCLSIRYQQFGNAEDLSEAIVHNQAALALRPPGHPERSFSLHQLAGNRFSQYKYLGRIEGLDESIELGREALVLRPLGHPARSDTMTHLADHLSARYGQLGRAEDRNEMFSLYTELARVAQSVTSTDLSATKAWVSTAEEFHDSTTLLAYETALRLLVQYVTSLPSLPQHLMLLKASASSLAIDAFSAFVRNQSPMTAVELLEQGRAVFWTQLTRLRSPLDDVIASGPAGRTLADEYTRLTTLIRNALNSPGSSQHDRVWHLNLELETVVSSIRQLPGLSCFLLPSPFTELRRAAINGPVIIMNASRYGCDALVLSSDMDPAHIPLSALTKEYVRELSSDLRALVVRAKRADVSKELRIFLRVLWDRVVFPVADFLRNTYPPRSRIWWCPTAELSLLPLHAAGPYRVNEKNFPDLFISSYTPTLSALIRARQPTSLAPKPDRKRFIAIGQANAIGTNQLHSVSTELANIGQQIDGLARFTSIEDQEACISRVTEELTKTQWAHLACHGIPNRQQPFESAFALHDGRLTIHRIIRCDLQNAEFAYLSACHTTVGDEESPDEVIHLAAAMQFTGFRSVIGTMWTVDDAATNEITSAFYKYMVDTSGRLDHTRAAFALWKTMRLVSVPLDQRILYVHLGA